MTEFSSINLPPTPPPLLLTPEEKLGMLLEEGVRAALHPPDGDKVTSAFWGAMPYIVSQAPPIKAELMRWLSRQHISVTSAGGYGKPISQLRRTVEANFAFDRITRFPTLEGHEDPQQWIRGALGMAADPHRMADFMVVQGLPLNTTPKGERYAPLEVLRQLSYNGDDEHWGEVWDAGSSVLTGVNQTVQKDTYPFAHAALLCRADRDAAGNPVWTSEIKELEVAYNALLKGPHIPGNFVSTDLFSPRDPIIIKRARAALRPMKELRDPDFMRDWEALAGFQNLPGVDFEHGDITVIEEVRRIKKKVAARHPAHHFRYAYFSMVMSQLGEEKIGSTMEGAMELLDDRYEDAAVLIFDYAQRDPRDPSAVRLHPHWDKGLCALLAVYKHDPERRVRTLFNFLTTRPTQVIIGEDEVLVDGAYMGVREALRHRHARLQERA